MNCQMYAGQCPLYPDYIVVFRPIYTFFVSKKMATANRSCVSLDVDSQDDARSNSDGDDLDNSDLLMSNQDVIQIQFTLCGVYD